MYDNYPFCPIARESALAKESLFQYLTSITHLAYFWLD